MPLQQHGKVLISGKSRESIVLAPRSERVVWIWHLIKDFNGCSGDARCIAARSLLQVQAYATSAKNTSLNFG